MWIPAPLFWQRGFAPDMQSSRVNCVKKAIIPLGRNGIYGVKLHAFVARHAGRLPTPLVLMLSGAASHDLTAAKQIMEDHHPLAPGTCFADKAYIDAAWVGLLKQDHEICIPTSRKKWKDDIIHSGASCRVLPGFGDYVPQNLCYCMWVSLIQGIGFRGGAETTHKRNISAAKGKEETNVIPHRPGR